MRLGIFGGTFDPVHVGHLLLAETCLEQCALDEVWFVPALLPPHKQRHTLTAANQRVEMLQLAVSGHRQLIVSTIELDRGGVSYTWETLQAIHDAHPDSELFFLMGADSLHDLRHWREPQRICELALPIAVRRAGSAEIDFNPLESIAQPQQIAQMRRCQVEMPLIELSSTNLRQRIAARQSVRFRLPRAVEKYIETQGLYLASEEATANSH
ncbi:MAG: nicotinate (nicotinamide) nucleotide adenylyltransferase [Planctomycetaceae bacterium]|nr:nicotinate (nicotinamide) nucleotide adenylyltransferase [Planctomycetaceae bacterium]